VRSLWAFIFGGGESERMTLIGVFRSIRGLFLATLQIFAGW
jgi:hypothetical protein